MADETGEGLARGLTNYGDKDFSLYLRRSFAKAMGFTSESLKKPIVGIADTASSYNNCHRNVPEQIEAVKRGVLAAGGLPMVFPTVSLGDLPPSDQHALSEPHVDGYGRDDFGAAYGRRGCSRRLR